MDTAPATEDKPIDTHRRTLLLGVASAALAQLSGCGGGGGSSMMGQSNSISLVDPAAAAAAERNLPIVPLDDGVADGSGERQFALTVQRGNSQILSGVSTPTLGYNGAMLGPALRLRTGERTTIRVRNDLDEVTTAHWRRRRPAPADCAGRLLGREFHRGEPGGHLLVPSPCPREHRPTSRLRPGRPADR